MTMFEYEKWVLKHAINVNLRNGKDEIIAVLCGREFDWSNRTKNTMDLYINIELDRNSNTLSYISCEVPHNIARRMIKRRREILPIRGECN